VTGTRARRFLHCCYCCYGVDAATRFFAEAFGLEEWMRSSRDPVDGTQMGFAGDVRTDTCFVYDRRGPRVSPAIEIQEWLEPPTTGAPYASPTNVGFHALGIAVADAASALARASDLGAQVAGRTDPHGPVAPGAALLRDLTGITIDVVEGPTDGNRSRLAHLRATCSDLDRSVEWYGGLGFEAVETTRTASVAGGPFGLGEDAVVSVARLRLPDEQFELVLVEWHTPRAGGAPYDRGNHAGLYRFAIAVDDTRAAHAALTQAGLTASPPPRVVALPGTNVPDMWIAFLTDPDGLTIELVERPRAAFRG
jgi:catechol 2,3-dioxygenase-like lactoylglutathione lyase family enzyme